LSPASILRQQPKSKSNEKKKMTKVCGGHTSSLCDDGCNFAVVLSRQG
jgi:hypothetical protein